MNVLSVIHAPEWGGIHTIMERVAPLCEARGWRWTVVLPKTGRDNGRERLERSGVRVAEIPLRRIRKTLNPIVQLQFLLTIPLDIFRLCRLIRTENIEIVQVCGLMHFHSAFAGRLMGKTVVWQLHSDQPPLALKKVFTPLVRLMAHSVMTAGHTVIEKHPGLNRIRERIFVFFAPINTTRYAPNDEVRAEVRQELGWTGDELVVATVGGRGPNKNHQAVVEVAERLKGRDARLRYAICGGWLPHHRDYYQSEVVDRADGYGLVEADIVKFVEPGSKVDRYMTAFDIFVLPSHGEGISVVTAEAMSTGMPVVVNEVGSMADFVEDGEVGYLNRSRTVDEMAEHVLDLAQNEAARTRMGRSARTYALQHLDENVCADVHVAAYEAGLARRRS